MSTESLIKFRFTVDAGDTLEIRAARGANPVAIVDADPDGGHPSVHVPPSEVPALARAIYEAAGLSFPDGIQLAGHLARDLADAAGFDADDETTVGDFRDQAAQLLARGWRRPS